MYKNNKDNFIKLVYGIPAYSQAEEDEIRKNFAKEKEIDELAEKYNNTKDKIYKDEWYKKINEWED